MNVEIAFEDMQMSMAQGFFVKISFVELDVFRLGGSVSAIRLLGVSVDRELGIFVNRRFQ